MLVRKNKTKKNRFHVEWLRRHIQIIWYSNKSSESFTDDTGELMEILSIRPINNRLTLAFKSDGEIHKKKHTFNSILVGFNVETINVHWYGRARLALFCRVFSVDIRRTRKTRGKPFEFSRFFAIFRDFNGFGNLINACDVMTFSRVIVAGRRFVWMRVWMEVEYRKEMKNNNKVIRRRRVTQWVQWLTATMGGKNGFSDRRGPVHYRNNDTCVAWNR